jgi:hypothetical protein
MHILYAVQTHSANAVIHIFYILCICTLHTKESIILFVGKPCTFCSPFTYKAKGRAKGNRRRHIISKYINIYEIRPSKSSRPRPKNARAAA